MCSKPLCLEDPWCFEWGCCGSDSDEDLKEAPKKVKEGSKQVTWSKRFVSPTSCVEMDKICKRWTRFVTVLFRRTWNLRTVEGGEEQSIK